MAENLKLSLFIAAQSNEKHNKEKVTRGDKTKISSINNEEDYPVLNEDVKLRRASKKIIDIWKV